MKIIFNRLAVLKVSVHFWLCFSYYRKSRFCWGVIAENTFLFVRFSLCWFWVCLQDFSLFTNLGPMSRCKSVSMNRMQCNMCIERDRESIKIVFGTTAQIHMKHEQLVCLLGWRSTPFVDSSLTCLY